MSEQTVNKQNKPKGEISFEVGFKDDKTRFDLNFISVAAEQEIQQQFNDLADSEGGKSEKEYKICLDALVKFSASDSQAQIIDKKFREYNLRNERIIRKAYLTFKAQLDPDVFF